MNRINRKSGFTLIEFLIVLVIAFILFIMVTGVVGCVAGRSDGKRIGTITKFSYKGVFIKSYEGELNLGGLRNRIDGEGNHTTVANVWEFSVTNPKVAEQIDNLLGKEVVMKYHQSFGGLSRETSYDVLSVEEVKPEPKR